MKKRYEIEVRGDVQGVSYRYHANEAAKKLGVTGWIRNEPDGSITIVVEGDKGNLDNFLAWCHEGSHLAEVKEILHREGDYSGEFEKFEIR